MKKLFNKHLMTKSLLLATCILPFTLASALTLPNKPLTASASVNPNMMLLLDSSGSMGNIVPDKSYDSEGNIIVAESYDEDTYSYTCTKNVLSNSYAPDVRIYSNGDVYIRINNNDYRFGNTNSTICFNNNLNYSARLYGDGGSNNGTKYPNGYLSAVYSGQYLNWYFDHSSNNFGSRARGKPGQKTRIQIAREASTALIENLADTSDINVGVAKFNSSSGAKIVSKLADVKTAEADLIDDISDISNSGMTPLAESFQHLGRYFSLAPSAYSTQDLILHPEITPVPASNKKTASETFGSLPSGSGSTPPITDWCQQNFIVAMTDGRPTQDRNIQSVLKDYDNDCSISGVCTSYDRKNSGYTYESSSASDYADDVIKAMHDMDLRPDLKNDGVDVKNNVTTYVIGFADAELSSDQLMKDMAEAGGGGELLSASNSAELTLAFKAATDSIFAKASAQSGVEFNSSQLSTDSAIYAASFHSAKWSGSLHAYGLDEDSGEIDATSTWNAAEKLDAMDYTTRNIFTYNAGGKTFEEGNLSTTQLADLKKGPEKDSDTGITNLINYIKGERDKEGSSTTSYRVRSSALGDIVNSTATYVSATPDSDWPDYATNTKFGGGGAGQSYSYFKNNTSRSPMVYVGANDGMLHGFNASLTDTTNGGKEKLAYIPGILYSTAEKAGLHYLANKTYDHQFYVDLAPTVSDVYFDDAWHSVLIGGLRSGGKGIFALDVTNPANFTATTDNASNLALWEFSKDDDADFGYSYSKPTVAMMANGKWAVIVGNGYNSTAGKASLFIIFIDEGRDGTWSSGDYIKINTNNETSNGLSTPTVIFDEDGVAERVYAGDLQGNMWAFDVSGSNSNQWDNTNNKSLLITAKDDESTPNRQPITSAPTVIENTNTSATGNNPNYLVFFGTGKYIEEADKTTTAMMSYYGVLDDGSANKTRSDLTERTLLTSGSDRELSGDDFTWSASDGWYIDLVDSTDGSSATKLGERVISDSFVSNDILFFNTAIPYLTDSSDVCSINSESWLMAVDLNTGKAPDFAIFDADGDGVISDDEADGDIGKSGIKSTGMVEGGILGDKVYLNSSEAISETNNDGNPVSQSNLLELAVNTSASGIWPTGRLSWEELIRGN